MSPLFWLQLALVYAFTFSCRLAEHGGVWVFWPRDSMILAEREELAEREKRGRKGGNGNGASGARKGSQLHAAASSAVEIEVERGRSVEFEVPVVVPAAAA